LRSGKHEGIVNHAGTGLDVVHGMSWVCAPGGCAEREADASPVVDANGAVAQLCYGALYRLGDLGIFERRGMDQDGGVERSPDFIIGKGNGALDIFDDAAGRQRGFAKEATEGFGGKANIVALSGIKVGDQYPG